jgi:hypothetical protein
MPLTSEMWGDRPLFQSEPTVTGKRPPHLKPPAHLSKSPQVPQPGPATEHEEFGGPKGDEPTRYGDWENNGRAWDF